MRIANSLHKVTFYHRKAVSVQMAKATRWERGTASFADDTI